MINVTKITEESCVNTRTYYKLEQVKTYKPNIVKTIVEQYGLNKDDIYYYGEIGNTDKHFEMNPMNCSHKIIDIVPVSDTQIKIISYVYPEFGAHKVIWPYLEACSVDKSYSIPLSYTLRGAGAINDSGELMDDFVFITFDLINEDDAGKNPLLCPNDVINDIAHEQASL